MVEELSPATCPVAATCVLWHAPSPQKSVEKTKINGIWRYPSGLCSSSRTSWDMLGTVQCLPTTKLWSWAQSLVHKIKRKAAPPAVSDGVPQEERCSSSLASAFTQNLYFSGHCWTAHVWREEQSSEVADRIRCQWTSPERFCKTFSDSSGEVFRALCGRGHQCSRRTLIACLYLRSLHDH